MCCVRNIFHHTHFSVFFFAWLFREIVWHFKTRRFFSLHVTNMLVTFESDLIIRAKNLRTDSHTFAVHKNVSMSHHLTSRLHARSKT